MKNMDIVINKAYRGSEVPLRAFWCKSRVRWQAACDKPLGEVKNCDVSCVYDRVNMF